MERLKYHQAKTTFPNIYFWRTHQKQEIDYIEESGGEFSAYEFKWKPGKYFKFPGAFVNNYTTSETSVVTPENYRNFITPESKSSEL